MWPWKIASQAEILEVASGLRGNGWWGEWMEKKRKRPVLESVFWGEF